MVSYLLVFFCSGLFFFPSQTGLAWSVGIKHVLATEGARRLLRRRLAQHCSGQRHKKPLRGALCPAFTARLCCEHEEECLEIHVSPRGYQCAVYPLPSLPSRPPSLSLSFFLYFKCRHTLTFSSLSLSLSLFLSLSLTSTWSVGVV